MTISEVATVPVITTRYIGPTNHKPGRVKAVSGSGKSLTVSWNHELALFENHAAAAAALAEKLQLTAKAGWDGPMVGGCLHNDGYAFAILRN
jgi:hypothetical protein